MARKATEAREGKLTVITEANLKKRLGRQMQRSANGRVLVNIFLNKGVVDAPAEIEDWQIPGIMEMDFCGKIEDGWLWGEKERVYKEEGQLIQTSTPFRVKISAIGMLKYYTETPEIQAARAKEWEEARAREKLHQELRNMGRLLDKKARGENVSGALNDCHKAIQQGL